MRRILYPMRMSSIRLRHVNTGLFAAIVVINLYIIAAPLWPQLNYWWQTNHSSRQQQLTRRSKQPATKTPGPNSIVIPAMLLDQPTLEGLKSNWFNLLKAGIWRWPDSSTPNKGGNTVFLAHRFSYTGP